MMKRNLRMVPENLLITKKIKPGKLTNQKYKHICSRCGKGLRSRMRSREWRENPNKVCRICLTAEIKQKQNFRFFWKLTEKQSMKETNRIMMNRSTMNRHSNKINRLIRKVSKLEKKLGIVEMELASIKSGVIPPAIIKEPNLPRGLILTLNALSKLNKPSTATDVSLITGTSRAYESAHLNQLFFLNKVIKTPIKGKCYFHITQVKKEVKN